MDGLKSFEFEGLLHPSSYPKFTKLEGQTLKVPIIFPLQKLAKHKHKFVYICIYDSSISTEKQKSHTNTQINNICVELEVSLTSKERSGQQKFSIPAKGQSPEAAAANVSEKPTLNFSSLIVKIFEKTKEIDHKTTIYNHKHNYSGELGKKLQGGG